LRELPRKKASRKWKALRGLKGGDLEIKRHTPSEVHNLIIEIMRKAFKSFDRPIEVLGEVADFYDNRKKSGWLYFSITDGSKRVRCMVPPESAEDMDFEIEEGSRVIVAGKFWVYEKEGRVELIVKSIKDAGPSEFEQQVNEIMDKLDAEGLLAKAETRHVTTAPPPKRVAIIAPPNSVAPMDIKTAATGAGGLTLILKSMKDYSVESIIDEISSCEKDRRKYDAIIITRGGGEDLSLYNDEQVVRTVAKCEIPVIAAIGHSDDRTLLDFVAAESMPTPTAAGNWLKELHQQHRREKKMGRKQLLVLFWIIIIIIVVLFILWGMGVFQKGSAFAGLFESIIPSGEILSANVS